MKRLALLLAAMGVISVGAMAEAPALKVTNIGQELEIENVSGSTNGDIGATTFTTTVGLSYEDWSFAVQAGKMWTIDTDNGFDSTNGRMQFDVWNKVNENLNLGFRYKGQSDYDRYYGRAAWNYGMVFGAADVWYQSVNGNGNDNLEAEIFPVGVSYGAFKAAWFVNYWKSIGNTVDGDKTEYLENQIRLYADLYKGEKLTLSTEARITLTADVDYEGGKKEAAPTEYIYKDFGRNRFYLGASYQVTESLNIYGKYAYEFREFDVVKTSERTDSQNYYGDFIVGWNYTF